MGPQWNEILKASDTEGLTKRLRKPTYCVDFSALHHETVKELFLRSFGGYMHSVSIVYLLEACSEYDSNDTHLKMLRINKVALKHAPL